MRAARWAVAAWFLMCGGLSVVSAQHPFRVMFYNVENLFDCHDDSLKDDDEFLPGGERRWTPYRYWRKLNAVAKVVAAVSADHLPELIGLCEVEGDSVLSDLTSRSSLRTLGYRYVMTHSPDVRGINVALLYQPGRFRLLQTREGVVPSVSHGFRPTRNILYAKGLLPSGDTLHVMVCHWPSRWGATRVSRLHRRLAARTLRQLVDSVHAVSVQPRVLVMGDFNAGADREVLQEGLGLFLREPSRDAASDAEIRGSYRYHGVWETLDHLLVSPALTDGGNRFHTADGKRRIVSFPFLCEPDRTYGGVRPFRTFQGPLYKGGYSDHFPVVLDFEWRFPDE